MKKETEDSHNQKLKLTENRSLFLRDKSIHQLSVLWRQYNLSKIDLKI